MPIGVAAAILMLLRRRDRGIAVAYIAVLAGLMGMLVFIYWNNATDIHHLLATSASRTVSTAQLFALVMLPVLLERALSGRVPQPDSA